MTEGNPKGSQSAPANTLATPLRASKRLVVSDQDSLEKATLLKAKKNLDGTPNKGNNLTTSFFIDLEDPDLASKVVSLGVSLGIAQVNKLVRL
jgi:hypothetical protein